MPLFHPVLNNLPTRETKNTATKWELFKARLFGKRLFYPSGKPMGWKHGQTVYITRNDK